ncbi:hypothetical protein BGZ65_007284, partial [Modicella reniformis]
HTGPGPGAPHELVITIPSSTRLSPPESTGSEYTPGLAPPTSSTSIASVSGSVSVSASALTPVSALASVVPAITITTESSSAVFPEGTATPTLTLLPRSSIAESSRVDGTTVQLPPTRAQLRIQSQLHCLQKFICVIGTLPLIATLLIYNRIELTMWWVVVLPVVGISGAVYCKWKLAKKLQRLQQEAQASRLSLPLMRQVSTTPQPLQGEDSEEPPAPPDYQSSIITPPAYITAQQPGKVPSYRSLEHLFSLARQGASILTRSAGVGNRRGTFQDEPAQDHEQEQEQECPPKWPEFQIHTSENIQVVVVFEELLDQPDPSDGPDGHLQDVTVDLELSEASPVGAHPKLQIRDTPEMTERSSEFRERTFRLWTGLSHSTVDVEEGYSGGHSPVSVSGSVSHRINYASTGSTPDVVRNEVGKSVSLGDDSTSEVEEQQPKQTTKDVKGKAPCRE